MGMNISQGGRGKRFRPMAEINVTPLVDVMLVLLIIFMVTAPFLTSGVELELPESSAEPINRSDEPLTISIKSDGKLYLEDTHISDDALAAKLQAIVTENPETQIYVRGDKRVPYGRVMQVMGDITSAGLKKVSFLTENNQ